MRLIVIALLIYLLYKGIKPWITPPADGMAGHTGHDNGRAGDLDDVMVKDPYCDVYFPKRTGIHLKFEGEDLYFCSEHCRDRFLESREHHQ